MATQRFRRVKLSPESGFGTLRQPIDLR